jgi:hypothetical protein
MRSKYYLIISLAGLLLSPLKAMAIDTSAFDQFTDAFGAGLFQGVLISNELDLELDNGNGNVQGINVISGNYTTKAVQVAQLTSDVSLSLSGSDNSIQGLNVYQGTANDGITQIAVVEGAVNMISSGNTGSIQGLNVITTCDSCN